MISREEALLKIRQIDQQMNDIIANNPAMRVAHDPVAFPWGPLTLAMVCGAASVYGPGSVPAIAQYSDYLQYAAIFFGVATGGSQPDSMICAVGGPLAPPLIGPVPDGDWHHWACTFDETHRKVMLPRVLTDLEDRNDTGMIETGCRFCLSVKPLHVFFASELARQNHFQSDNAIQIRLPRFKDYTHPATSDLF